MRMIFKYALLSGIIMFTVFGCKKNTYRISAPSTPANVALVKIAWFSATTLQTPVQAYINMERVTNTLLQPISFPGGGLNMNGSLNADYLQVTPGSVVFDFYVPVTGTAIAASKYFSTIQTVDANKKYTLFVTDTAANTTAFIVTDDLPGALPDSGIAKLKFVNAIPGTAEVDLYKGPTLATSTLLKSAIKYKSSTDYFDVPSGTDSFFVRLGGQPTTVLPIVRRGFALGSQRVYTMLGRGYIGQVSTALRGINLSVIVNQ